MLFSEENFLFKSNLGGITRIHFIKEHSFFNINLASGLNSISIKLETNNENAIAIFAHHKTIDTQVSFLDREMLFNPVEIFY